VLAAGTKTGTGETRPGARAGWSPTHPIVPHSAKCTERDATSLHRLRGAFLGVISAFRSSAVASSRSPSANSSDCPTCVRCRIQLVDEAGSHEWLSHALPVRLTDHAHAHAVLRLHYWPRPVSFLPARTALPWRGPRPTVRRRISASKHTRTLYQHFPLLRHSFSCSCTCSVACCYTSFKASSYSPFAHPVQLRRRTARRRRTGRMTAESRQNRGRLRAVRRWNGRMAADVLPPNGRTPPKLPR